MEHLSCASLDIPTSWKAQPKKPKKVLTWYLLTPKIYGYDSVYLLIRVILKMIFRFVLIGTSSTLGLWKRYFMIVYLKCIQNVFTFSQLSQTKPYDESVDSKHEGLTDNLRKEVHINHDDDPTFCRIKIS